MVISMDMESGARIYGEPVEEVGMAYGDEVLNANPLPPELALALGLQEVASVGRGQHAAPTDVEAFLAAVYRYQE
ncbi:MAG: hypothetical protein JSS57_09675 [Proteobacteria bacterium]|nr:hypothetical protein [Pseudomonadota bacterium]